MHPLAEVVNNFVDGGGDGGFPRGGTHSKIFARRAGGPGAIGTQRTLSTGRPVQGRRVEDETKVLTAPDGGVRFGVYTCPMTTQMRLDKPPFAVSTAAVGAVGR
uniref:hypothetical protein n=1 Tax=Streptomyces sp. NBC_01001 TaxID=2903713 RepID=UPI002F915282